MSERMAKKILDQLSIQELARKAYFIASDNEEMWGATAIVGLLPKPLDFHSQKK
jgi:hypothetical protein